VDASLKHRTVHSGASRRGAARRAVTPGGWLTVEGGTEKCERGKRLSPVRISLAYSRHDGRMLRGDRPAIVSRVVARPSSVKSFLDRRRRIYFHWCSRLRRARSAVRLATEGRSRKHRPSVVAMVTTTSSSACWTVDKSELSQHSPHAACKRIRANALATTRCAVSNRRGSALRRPAGVWLWLTCRRERATVSTIFSLRRDYRRGTIRGRGFLRLSNGPDGWMNPDGLATA